MSNELHFEALSTLCRICAKSIKRHRVTYKCCEYTELIRTVFKVNALEDDASIHPHNFCHYCYLTIQHAIVAPGQKYTHTVSVYTWEPHTSDCNTCNQVQQIKKGGRPQKRKRGRPKQDGGYRTIIKFIRSVTPPSYWPNEVRWSPVLEPRSASVSAITCPICLDIVDQPMELIPCNSHICSTCLCSALEASKEPSCPCCYTDHLSDSSTIRPVTPIVNNLIINTIFTCPSCNRYVTLENVIPHHNSACKNIASCPPLSISSILSTSNNHPLTQTECRLTTNLVRRSLKNGILQVETAGQPLTLVQVSNPRIRSSKVSQKTLFRRSQQLAKLRHRVSKGDEIEQFSSEVRSLKKQEREQILKEAGLLSSACTSVEEGLAMKASLNLPWNTLRLLKRWLGKWGLKLPSERHMRHAAKQICTDNITSENAMFTFPVQGGEELRAQPIVYIPNIIEKVMSLLDENDRLNNLTWHDIIPKREIWIKLGGDKGGNSFKLTFQIVNTLHPNSPYNTHILLAFQAGDSYTNLKIAMESCRSQIVELQAKTWRRKQIKLFLAGDYEFLTKLYGLSGANGRHFCLYCLIATQDSYLPYEEQPVVQLRTLESIKRDHDRFVKAGVDIRKVKLYNNCPMEAIFDIPIDQVCPPALHISLGIYHKLYSIMEGMCHILDIQLLTVGDGLGGRVSVSYEKHRALLNEVTTLQATLRHEKMKRLYLEQLYTALVLTKGITSSQQLKNTGIPALHTTTKRTISHIEKEIGHKQAVLNKGFGKDNGPFVKHLDQALCSFNVQRQAYYSGTFVGNHVHLALNPNNIATLCSAPVVAAEQHCRRLIAEAKSIQELFFGTFSKFAACYELYSQNYLSLEEIAALEVNIADFMAHYRNNFEENVTPKMHILEHHVTPFIKRWKLGTGLMGEQGAESIHACINTITRRYKNIRNKEKQLLHVIKEHCLLTSPSSQSKVPMPRPKKRKTQ